MKKVETWAKTATASERSALEQAFYNALNYGAALTGFFENIYVPVQRATSEGMPETVSYEKIGYTYQEIASIYYSFFAWNYIVEPLREYPSDLFPYVTAPWLLGQRIKAVLDTNKYKYIKNIELLGYAYNPIWNVDGEEIYSSLEAEGVTDETTTTELDQLQYTNTERVQQINRNTYEGTSQPAETVTTTEENAMSGDDPTKNFVRSRADPEHNVTERTYTHHNADNGGAEFEVNAEDTAFGQAVAGGDKYHTEKRIRRGNIGLTATQDLIEKQRIVVKFSILKEFFKDINEQILIGIYK